MTVYWHDLVIHGSYNYAEITMEDIGDWIISAVWTYYDAMKTSAEETLQSTAFGDDPVIEKYPSIAVIPVGEEFEDEPQDTGAEMRARFNIRCYTSDLDNEDNARKNLRLNRTMRRIIQWNKNLHQVSAPTTGRVWQILPIGTIDYSGILKEDAAGENPGKMESNIPVEALYYEGGY